MPNKYHIKSERRIKIETKLRDFKLWLGYRGVMRRLQGVLLILFLFMGVSALFPYVAVITLIVILCIIAIVLFALGVYWIITGE